MSQAEVSLSVLICHPASEDSALLNRLLRNFEFVFRHTVEGSLDEARVKVNGGECNVIFIDPLRFDLDAASTFVFETRKLHPSIVFVLYIDRHEIEEREAEFFAGNRSRFSHYFMLPKAQAEAEMREELGAILSRCRRNLSWRPTATQLRDLQREFPRLQEIGTTPDQISILNQLERVLDQVAAREQTLVDPGTVFVSYSFAEADYAGGLRELLQQRGLSPVTGDRAKSSISAAIIERIKKCEFFLSLLTRDKRKEDGNFTTSAWLLEEKGAALALGKPIVIMVEDGVDEIGGLQGDWQRIHFSSKSFTLAALKAVEQLSVLAGQGK